MVEKSGLKKPVHPSFSMSLGASFFSAFLDVSSCFGFLCSFFSTSMGASFSLKLSCFLLCPSLFGDEFLTSRVILLGGGGDVGGDVGVVCVWY